MLPLAPPLDLDRETAAAQAAAELARAKYGGPFPPWLVDAWMWFVRRLEDLWRLLNPRPVEGGDDTGRWVLLIVMALLLAVIGWAVWRFGLPRWSARVKDAEVGTDAAMAADDYRAVADQRARAGDHRAAVRERFRALVRELEMRDVIERRAARTAYETAALAGRELPTVAGELQSAAALFNDVMYGQRSPTGLDYGTIVAADAAVLAAAERGVASLGAL